MPRDPISFQHGELSLRRPDLDDTLIGVHDPEHVHPWVAIDETLIESIVVRGGWAQHLGDQRNSPYLQPSLEDALLAADDEDVGLREYVLAPPRQVGTDPKTSPTRSSSQYSRSMRVKRITTRWCRTRGVGLTRSSP